ncbi:MAG: methyltransferase domain-containing protein [Candidatus Rokuibacteriota bacterium]
MNRSGTMLAHLKKTALRSEKVIIALHIVDEWKARRRLRVGDVAETSGSTHSDMDLSASLDYIERVFRDYLDYGGFSKRDLQGVRILEIGPGDNFGVALKFIAAGAGKVVCLDRFYSKRDPAQQRSIYQAMRASLPDPERERFDQAITFTRDGAEVAPERIRYLYGFGIEEAARFLSDGCFDLMISRAVLEHFYDSDKALEVMDRLLAPGGRHLHKVDFTDHKMFSGNGLHPLTFLTIRDEVYRLMSRDTGGPNRRLIDFYRSKLRGLGYEFSLLKTHVFGAQADIVPHEENLSRGTDYTEETLALLRQVRPRLLPRYRNLSDEVSGVFIVARKPEAGGAEAAGSGAALP